VGEVTHLVAHAYEKKGDEVERVGTPFAVAWRGLATNLHEMGVPTKVIQRVCRHADEATTKRHYIHATEPGVQSGMRKLEASIIREKYERRKNC
jgi:integrase